MQLEQLQSQGTVGVENEGKMNCDRHEGEALGQEICQPRAVRSQEEG